MKYAITTIISKAKEKGVGRYCDVEVSKFRFKRRLDIRESFSGSIRPMKDIGR